MLTDPGRARLELCVSVSAPSKIRMIVRPFQLLVLPIAVMVVVPVTWKLDPVLGGVIVEDDAMSEPDWTT
jgi:hypothetical protein